MLSRANTLMMAAAACFGDTTYQALQERSLGMSLFDVCRYLAGVQPQQLYDCVKAINVNLPHPCFTRELVCTMTHIAYEPRHESSSWIGSGTPPALRACGRRAPALAGAAQRPAAAAASWPRPPPPARPGTGPPPPTACDTTCKGHSSALTSIRTKLMMYTLHAGSSTHLHVVDLMNIHNF